MPPVRHPSALRLAVLAALLPACRVLGADSGHGTDVPAGGGGPADAAPLVITGSRDGELERTDAAGRPAAADQRMELDGDDLARDGVQTLGDLDRYDPRISVVEDRGHGGIGDIRVRGLGGARVQVTQDGVPLADDPAGRGYVDPNMLSGVAVSFGPGSARGGADAVAGSVDFRTLRPEDVVAPGESYLLGRGFGSTLDGLLGLHARAAAGGQAVAGLVAATVERSHERAAVGAAVIPPQDTTVTAALGAVHVDLLPGWRTTLVADGYQDRTDIVQSDAELLQQRTADRRRRWRTALESGAQVADGQRLTAHLVLQDTTSRTATTTRDFHDDAIGFNRTTEARNEFDQRMVAGGVLLAVGRPTADLVLLGADARFTTSQDLQGGETTTIAPASAQDIPATRSFPTSDSWSGGVSGEWRHVFRDPAWAVEAAGRVDAYRLDVTVDQAYERSLAGQNAPTDLTAVAPTGRLALLWTPAGDQVAYTKLATGYRNGRFDEANQAFTNYTNGYTISPNPDLGPERSVGLELGWRRDGDLNGELTAHYTWYRDFIASRFVGTVPNSTGIGQHATLAQYQSVNVEAVEIHGLDGRVGAELPLGCFTGAALSWTAGRDRATGDGLDDLDPLRGTASFGWHDARDARHPDGALRITAAARFAGRKQDATADDAFVPAGWAAFDLRVGWSVTSRCTIDAAWINVFDARYWNWADVRALRTTSTAAARDSDAAEPGHATLSLTAVW